MVWVLETQTGDTNMALTNSQMTANRYGRWAAARAKAAYIKRHLLAGRTVIMGSAIKQTKLTAKNIDMVKATKTGLYIQHGKSWLCYDFNSIHVFS